MWFIKFSSNEYLIYFHDITELRENFQKIIFEREKFKTTIQSISEVVIVTDSKGKVELI